jgi:glycosyltransferase involved in cell wall biosynthesis
VKILHVPNAYFPVVGGTERICQRLSEVLASLGHDVRVVTTNVGSVEGYYKFGVPRIERQNDSIGDVSVIRLPFSNALYTFGGWAEKSLPSWLGNRLAGRTMEFLRCRLADMITRQITQIRPDVVMTMPHLVVNVEAVLAARRRVQFPLVMVPMLHEHDPNWNARAMSEALSCADAVVALTTCEVDRLSHSYGVPREKIFLAMVGADPVNISTGKRLRQIVFLGRKARSKGIGELIVAMEYVWRACPDVELLIAGVRTLETIDIDRQIASLPDYWRRLVKDLGVVSGAGKEDLFRTACCLVLPSKIESFGMVILDAWAHATPVIAWDLPVFRSIIEDGRTGLLVDPSGGSRAIGEAILRVLQDTESARRMGFAGYRQIQTVYSWQKVADVYLEAYQYAMRHAKSN